MAQVTYRGVKYDTNDRKRFCTVSITTYLQRYQAHK